jgi:hypothetical protein
MTVRDFPASDVSLVLDSTAAQYAVTYVEVHQHLRREQPLYSYPN